MKNKNKIEAVKIEHKAEENPDTSWMGEYTDDVSEFAIIRNGEDAGKYCGDMGEDYDFGSRGRESRFFLPPVDNYRGEPIEDVKKYGLQDWKRAEALNNGDWQFIGVIAKAQIRVNGISQTVRSGGLWGIESDSDESYLKEQAKYQMRELCDVLDSLGFSRQAIQHAFKQAETVNA